MKSAKALQSQRAYACVKEEVRWYAKKLSLHYGEVPRRFIREMVTGMIRSGECLLSSISRAIHRGGICLHSEEKRLSYEINNTTWTTEAMLANHHHLVGRGYLDAETVIALDLTDVSKPHGRVYEHLTYVKDGSTGEVVPGYWGIVIEAIKSKGQHLPLLMQLFSDKVKTYQSQFEEIRRAVERVVSEFGTQGLWVMDRGFDSLRNFRFFNSLQVRFLIRGYHERLIEEHLGVPVKLLALIQQKTLRGVDTFYKQHVVGKHGQRRTWQQYQTRICYDYFPIQMVYGSEEEVAERARVELFVIVVEGIGKPSERSFFFTNDPLTTLAECHRLIKRYARRWSCEEAIRFVKQEFALEDVRVQHYQALQRMMEFCMVCYTFVCLFIERCTRHHKTIYWWLHDLSRRRQQPPRFAHYRILEAIRKVLNLDFFDDHTLSPI